MTNQLDGKLIQAALCQPETDETTNSDLFAMGVIAVHFNGRIVILPSEISAMESEMNRSPVPQPIRQLLGRVLDRDRVGLLKNDIVMGVASEYPVMHYLVKEKGAELSQAVGQVLQFLVKHRCDDLRCRVRSGPVDWSVWTEGLVESMGTSKTIAKALLKNEEQSQRLDDKRREKDPTINGRPRDALLGNAANVVDLGFWCVRRDLMMKSPNATLPEYVRVIDELADRCLATMPKAHGLAAKALASDPVRWGTQDCVNHSFCIVDNTALPRYIRLLLKRKDFKRAAQFCNVAVECRIKGKTDGIFEKLRTSAMKGGEIKIKLSR